MSVSATPSLALRPIDSPPAHKPEQLPFWLTESWADRLQAEAAQLQQWLAESKISDLRQLAQQRGWSVRGTTKERIAEQVASALLHATDAPRVALALDGEHRCVLWALLLVPGEHGGSDAIVQVLAEAAGALQHQPLGACIGRLCSLGLALPGTALDRYNGRAGFVPRPLVRSLLPALPDLWPLRASPPEQAQGRPANAESQEAQAPADELRLGNPYAFVRAVHQVMSGLELPPPVALRPPLPRPVLEDRMPWLRGWDYDAAELERAERARKLQDYWHLALTVPPPQRALTDEAVERLAPLAGDKVRLDFIYALLLETGLCQPGSPVTAWPEVNAQFLRGSELAQHAILARAYFQTPHWSELWELLREDQAGIPGHTAGALQLKRRLAHQQFVPAHLASDLVRQRQVVLHVLACYRDGQWVEMDELLTLLRVLWPWFNHQPGEAVWYGGANDRWFLTRFGEAKSLDTLENDRDWDLAQGRFIRRLVAGPLHWLGLVDLTFRDGEVSAVRCRGLADLYWDRLEALTPTTAGVVPQSLHPAEQAEAISIQGQLIAFNPAVVSVQAHGLLERIGRLEEARVERFAYHLDAQVAHRSFEAGLTLAQILADWEAHLPVPMPEAIRTLLQGWWEGYGRVRLYRELTVIELGDDYALAEMKAVTSLSEHLIAEISPRLVIIDRAAADLLVAELEKAGYTPKRTDRV